MVSDDDSMITGCPKHCYPPDKKYHIDKIEELSYTIPGGGSIAKLEGLSPVDQLLTYPTLNGSTQLDHIHRQTIRDIRQPVIIRP